MLDTPFTWKRFTAPTANEYNEKPRLSDDNFADNGTLWGRFESGKSSNTTTLFDSDQPETTATIRLNQWVDISVKDQLIDLQFNERWQIKGVHKDRETYETVLSVKRNRAAT